MSRIKIRNFGPIKEGYLENEGWIDIKKVTVFIGNQGSGKSTVSKLISTLSWLEKSMYREDLKILSSNQFKEFCAYQGLKNYFRPETQIGYEGDRLTFLYSDKKVRFNRNGEKKRYLVPKIMYVPAERNFLSAVDEADNVKGLPKPLYTFLDEFRRAQRELSNELKLPVGKMSFKYDQFRKTGYIVGQDYQIDLLEASSGLQSLVPLFLVSWNLALSINRKTDRSKNQVSLFHMMQLQNELEKVLLNENLSDELKQAALELISSKYENSCFINIVEEPEQNLFPTSQWQMLKSLLEFNNINDGNTLILTTHSPYIINYLSIAIQGGYLKSKIEKSKNPNKFLETLNNVVPIKSTIQSHDAIIYQLDERNGTIKELPSFEGIPSDKNYLNQSIAEGNRLFDALLEIEEDLNYEY